MPANLPPDYFVAEKQYREASWGSGKHEGILVSRDHVLQDGDMVELHI